MAGTIIKAAAFWIYCDELVGLRTPLVFKNN
jgi:hypothetical protein